MQEHPETLGREAAEEAVTLLKAVDPEPGMQAVVLGAKHSGVMIHEAVGHPLEADGHWKKTAVLHPYWHQMVASDIVTIVDDPTLPGLRGSLAIDDEGATHPTDRTHRKGSTGRALERPASRQ